MKPINEMTLLELQESLRWTGDNFEYLQKACYDYADRISVYANRINELNRWVPVEERLPAECILVLLLTHTGRPAVGYIADGIWYFDGLNKPVQKFLYNITHWCTITPEYKV